MADTNIVRGSLQNVSLRKTRDQKVKAAYCHYSRSHCHARYYAQSRLSRVPAKLPYGGRLFNA